MYAKKCAKFLLFRKNDSLKNRVVVIWAQFSSVLHFGIEPWNWNIEFFAFGRKSFDYSVLTFT